MNRDDRIHELEDEIKQLKRRLDEARQDRDKESALVADMREHVEDANATIDRWIESFDMVKGDDGLWHWEEGLIQERDRLQEMYLALRGKWNKLVPEYNASVAPRRRNFGRPLAASESQQLDVLKRRNDQGQSLRAIADETNLSLRTVRTIVDKGDRKDRGTLARLQRIAPNRLAEAEERSRKRMRDALPRRIAEMHKSGAELIKKAKGLR